MTSDKERGSERLVCVCGARKPEEGHIDERCPYYGN